MVSREPTGALRTILPAAALGLVGVLGVTGCSAGQVTQTDSIEPAVNGNQGQVGDIALRDVRVAYPDDGDYAKGDDAPLLLTIINDGSTATELVDVTTEYAADARLLGNATLPGRFRLQVIEPEEPTENEAPETSPTTMPTDTQTSVTATDTQATQTSETEEPPISDGSTLPEQPPGSEESEVSSTSEVVPSEPNEQSDPVGTMSIVLTDLVRDLPVGRNIPVTFIFANGDEITIDLPVATPTTARPEPTEHGEDGH